MRLVPVQAFGNAKTIRNNNSSRFGRFMQLDVAKEGGIRHGSVLAFLLEKSRILTQVPQVDRSCVPLAAQLKANRSIMMRHGRLRHRPCSSSCFLGDAAGQEREVLPHLLPDAQGVHSTNERALQVA